ncbi:MAG: transposase [bacterium]
MREMDFSDNNLFWRWLGVKSIWRDVEQETRHYVKRRLERAMESEATTRVGCARYQRSCERKGYRNGSYSRDLLTSYGWIEGLEVPRVREGGFVSEVFDKYRRRQRMVDIVLLEAFLLGHSTRKTRRLFRRLFGSTISAQAVSNVVHELDDDVRSFHQRSLGDGYQAVYLDGLWLTLDRLCCAVP